MSEPDGVTIFEVSGFDAIKGFADGGKKRLLVLQLFHLKQRRDKGIREPRDQPNQSPKGIIWSAVSLPCFFDVVKSKRVAG